jgi:hypothetical protein
LLLFRRSKFPLSENRAVVAQKLDAYLNRRAEKIRDVSAQEIDAAVDESRRSCAAQPRMRIVLDTNILIRANARARGPARERLQLIAGSWDHTLLLSPFLLQE